MDALASPIRYSVARSSSSRSGGDLARSRRARHPAEAIPPQQRLRGGLDRGAGAIGLGLERSQGVVGGVGALELALVAGRAGQHRHRLEQLARALSVRPPHHVVHGPVRRRGGEQQRRQPLLGRDRPEVTAFDPAVVQLAGRGQAPGDLQRPVPAAGAPQRRPGVRFGAAESERVEHEHGAEAPAAGQRAGQQVGLDRGGHRRAVPFQQRRHGQPRRFARLRGAERHQRMALFGVQQPPPVTAQRQPPGAGRSRQRAQLARAGPPRSARMAADRRRQPGADRGAEQHRSGCRQQGERGIEAARTGEPLPGARRPGLGRMCEPAREPDQHLQQGRRRYPRPTAAEQRAGDPAPQPQKHHHGERAGDQREHGAVGDPSLTTPRHLRLSLATVACMPLSVSVSRASIRDRWCWTTNERLPTRHSA